ncbi:TonB-dependent receptor [Terrimonas sp. NA20]|uniref:TonB-dependent receptor n=1 Tax=Terrimonas ginsenosidimutans TaxID=2908004 RepID=A0ABS9KS69_9BACT|nr:TonB-dependent receptor [Terrimonas ginsenosidimutans]MCG2615173.1 TonB-dependent receptor [Terrimonas ginsenosidimutans]
MKSLTLSFCFIFSVIGAMAQNTGKLSGNISKDGKPAEGATISLLRAKDSAVVKLSTTNNQGSYVFENIAGGHYLISATAVGHLKAWSGKIELAPKDPVVHVPSLTLVPVSKDLAGVTVSSKRPLVEQRIDRTIVNVEASITNIGTSALEVLEKAPGVTVDRDGNISLKGKEGVLILVDGRPTQLSGPDLANLLRNMNSSQLDQLEIMTNPPARYEAAGTAGIINIKTKKAITAGFNGSASVAYSQGKYPKTNEGFNFNYRNAKFNFFTNLSHNYQKRFQIMNIDRNILDDNNNSVLKIFNQVTTRNSAGNAYNAKFGVDFFADKRTTFGAVVNLNARQMSSDNPNTTLISNAVKQLQTVTDAFVNTESAWKSINANLNYRRILDQKGKEITSDIDFVKHITDNDLFMVNSYTDATGNPISKADTLTGLLPQDIDVYSAKVDYLHPLGKDARFEAGIKTSIVRTDNNARYDSVQYGQVIPDLNRSNHFVYQENINAAYLNLSTPLSKKISAQFGLRMENTNATGQQKSTGENFSRHYTQLFPTAYFQYKANDKNNFGANFGRRVRRPSYQSLNPFIRFLDRYTYSQGNPNLKPSISNNVELTHTWNNQVTTTLNYTNVKDIIQEVIQQKGEEAYNMPENVSSLNTFGLSVNANTPVAKWWTSNININVNYDKYKGVISNDPIRLSATSFVINGTQQFKISKTFTAELNGMFRSGWLEGVIRVKPVTVIGAGVSQQVLKGKGTVRLTARDIFYSQRMRGKSRYANVDVNLRQRSETQIVTIGFTYNFSKGKKIAPVKRTSGSAGEEQNRIGQ